MKIINQKGYNMIDVENILSKILDFFVFYSLTL